ncbi:hypothetical protein P170DRAFT_479764 [Aspergillus steynii IBT 23096]|uniref:Uncharacterized protein n=1 Tax=Aspergillus steynii IBT 23096 TaxID=1392250 RepID=A0A2I2FX76_9EURO|nr:uncharacterized protein P170DRAFT_479764 [Aspergillus steynii IBT 23096]PLB45245.1 hypothetical protein P170DRAFT_479764 [Aspergillus steynii IBT 23096]
MPMKWTPENDQLLLLKILETHDLSVDTKRVADAWPINEDSGKKNDRPTPRAITERLVRMRQIVKSTGTGTSSTDGHFSIGKGTGSAPSTPRKPRASGLKTPSTSGKRKLSGLGDASQNAHRPVEEDDTPTHKKPLHPTLAGMNRNGNPDQVGVTLKLEVDDDEGFVDQLTPSPKRVRKASTLPLGMVSYKEEDDDDLTVESSSEYTPDQVREDDDIYA